MKIIFLYVDEGMKYLKADLLHEKMDNLAKTLKLKDYKFTIYDAPTVEKGVLEYANDIKPDVVIMYTHGHNGLRRIFENSVAEDVVNHADVPVMTVLA